MRKKVAVFGAGFVGSTTAQRIVEKGIADVVLIDVLDGPPQGKALDILESGPVEGFCSKIIGSTDESEIFGSDVVVVTAGLARKPGMSREDLVQINSKIISQIGKAIKKYAPESIVIVVTNPLDIMTYVMFSVTGFKPERVMGMAGVLDSARYRTFLSEVLGVNVNDIQAMVLGGHGDDMVPLMDCTTVAGIPIRELLPANTIAEIIQRTRQGGGEIVSLLKTGSAYYAPSASVVQMVDAILLDQKRLLPVSALLTGQYDIHNVYVGVPVVLGCNGIERIIEIKLNSEDRLQLQKSAKVIKDNLILLGL